jgi:hypothetical protein
MALSRRATQIALIVAVPIAALASLMEIVAIRSATTVGRPDAYEFADMLFLTFGYPLTRIVLILAPGGLQESQNWWGVPLLDALLIFQWVVWLQGAVYIGRGLRRLWRVLEIPVSTRPTIWPHRITKADGRRFKMRPHKMRLNLPQERQR